MRILARILLSLVFVAAVVLAGVLLFRPKQPETWATLTAVLAVVAAVIAAWPSLRVLEIQEDATRPCPTPYFDVTSRYGFLLLRVKNLGAGVAYDVHLTWGKRPQNEEGKEVAELDTIPVLIPQESVSVRVGRPHELFRKYPNMRFEGKVEFKDATGKRMTQPFICNADQHRHRLVHDDEMPRTLRDLQEIPQKLTEIAEAIRKNR